MLRVLISLWGCVLVHCKVVNCSCRGLLWWCVNQLCWNRTTFGLPRSWKYPFGGSLRWPKTDVDVDVENFHSFSLCLWRKTKKKYSMSRRWRYMSHVFFMISPVQKINLAWIRTLVRAVLGKSGILAKKIKKKKRLQHLSFAYGHPLHYSVRLSQA